MPSPTKHLRYSLQRQHRHKQLQRCMSSLTPSLTVQRTNPSTQDTLKWDCTCASNSSAPGLQYYTQTVPTFICQELLNECVSQTNTQKGTEECRTKIEPKCAKQNPPKNVASDDDGDDESTTASNTATASATKTSSDASGTAAAVSSTSSDAFAAPTMAPAGKGAAAAVALGMLAYLV